MYRDQQNKSFRATICRWVFAGCIVTFIALTALTVVSSVMAVNGTAFLPQGTGLREHLLDWARYSAVLAIVAIVARLLDETTSDPA